MAVSAQQRCVQTGSCLLLPACPAGDAPAVQRRCTATDFTWLACTTPWQPRKAGSCKQHCPPASSTQQLQRSRARAVSGHSTPSTTGQFGHQNDGRARCYVCFEDFPARAWCEGQPDWCLFSGRPWAACARPSQLQANPGVPGLLFIHSTRQEAIDSASSVIDVQVLLTSNIACWRTANFWKPTKEGATTSAAVYVLSIVLIVGAVCSYLHSHHSASSWHLICTVLRCSYTQLPLQSDSTNDT